MKIVRAGILSNPKKDISYKGACRAAKLLRKRGAEVFFDESGLPEGEKDIIDYSQIDCLFVLGGDGTILNASVEASRFGVCMLGINLGRLGFLTEIELRDIDKAINDIFENKYYIEKRTMLNCSVCDSDKEIFSAEALNDVAVTKKDMARMINIELIINGKTADKVPCDGMLVSTPTGSTGYSLSAGGPIVCPRLECMIATPICPHSLHSRAIVVSSDDALIIKPASPNGMVLTTDGILQREILSSQIVKIKKSQHVAHFIRFKKNYFYPLLRSKFLNWDR